jgi:hypothetical protein
MWRVNNPARPQLTRSALCPQGAAGALHVPACAGCSAALTFLVPAVIGQGKARRGCCYEDRCEL